MSDDDLSAFGRFQQARMSPSATASEENQLVQKMFNEHPQLLQVSIAGRGLIKSLNPDALAFLGRVVCFFAE